MNTFKSVTNCFTFLVACILYFELNNSCSLCLDNERARGLSAEQQIQPCNVTACNVAGCLCCGTSPPYGWQPSAVPKMVLVTFSGSLNTATYNLYSAVLAGVTNPNGCPAAATFFAQHDYSDYTTIVKVYNDGHDVGVNSVSGLPVHDPGDYKENYAEIAGMKAFLQKYSLIPDDDIKGYRAPWHVFAGDVILQVLNDTRLSMESSLINRIHQNPIWPYSFDYSAEQCPGLGYESPESFPGVWEFPVNDFIDGDGRLCPSLDGCYYNQSTIPDAYTLLTVNYNYHVTRNVPFMVVVTAGWLAIGDNGEDLRSFLQDITSNENAYVVSLNQALAWFQQPTLAKDIPFFKPWQCHLRPPVKCDTEIHCQCQLEDKSSRQFYFCAGPGGQSCPAGYPWLEETYRGSCKQFN